MLKNELTPLIALLNLTTVTEDGCQVFQEDKRWDFRFETAMAKVRDAWTLAIFEDKNGKKLKRYFGYHLRIITDLFDKQNEFAKNVQYPLGSLIELTDHLLSYFNSYLDKKIPLPATYISWKLAHLKRSADSITDLLLTRAVDQQLANCLRTLFDQYFIVAHVPKITLGMLDYINLVLQELQGTLAYSFQDDINKLLVEKLMALNFNQLLFFAYLKNEVRQRMDGVSPIEQYELLQHHAADVGKPKSVKGLYYDPNWPHICILLQSWLKEEAAILAKGLSDDMISLSMLKKIELNLSVPQLACFIWVFFEEKMDHLSNLTQVFELTTRYFSTKHQPTISAASLSNNYYGISQATATNVKAKLLNMVALINKHYFPVMAAAGVLIGAC